MNMEAFSALVLCLKNAVENASEYLLDVNSIVLTPEYIYMNPGDKGSKSALCSGNVE